MNKAIHELMETQNHEPEEVAFLGKSYLGISICDGSQLNPIIKDVRFSVTSQDITALNIMSSMCSENYM